MGVATSPATGARGAVHLGEETEYGEAVQPTHIIDFTSESLAASENVIESESIRADRGRHKLIRGNLDIQGDLSFEQAASGYGMLMKHALGDYLKVTNADGGIHGRMRRAEITKIDAPGAVGDKAVLLLADDHSGGFDVTNGGQFCLVYRDANDDLQVDNNGGAGYAYSGAATRVVSYITTYTAADTHETESTPSITVAQVYDEDGNAVDPEYCSEGGVIEIGANRKKYRYWDYEKTGGSGTKLFLVDSDALDSSGEDVATQGAPSTDEFVISYPCVGHSTATTYDAASANIKLGTFVYDYDSTNYTGVYTHHIERGRYLPTGLTVEVDRDAAIFIYSGCKVNTLNLSFETNSIVTGSISLVGKEEHAMAELVEDVKPGVTSIKVSKGTMFPSGGGTITIDEETEITFTGKTGPDADGNYTLTGIPATGTNSIQRPHELGANVDSRTSTAVASPVEGNSSPLTSFETLVYMEGAYQEVLSGSLTLNNNLNTDKFGLGSRQRLQLVEQQAVVEASLTVEFDDGKMYKKFIEADYFSLEFKCISEADDSEIGNTGVLSQAYYLMPKCKFNGNTPQISGTSYITHDMPVTCIVDDELDTTDLVVILVNGLSQDVEN